MCCLPYRPVRSTEQTPPKVIKTYEGGVQEVEINGKRAICFSVGSNHIGPNGVPGSSPLKFSTVSRNGSTGKKKGLED